MRRVKAFLNGLGIYSPLLYEYYQKHAQYMEETGLILHVDMTL